MARSTNSLWLCFVRTNFIVERRRLKVFSDLSVMQPPITMTTQCIYRQNAHITFFKTFRTTWNWFTFRTKLASHTNISAKVQYSQNAQCHSSINNLFPSLLSTLSRIKHWHLGHIILDTSHNLQHNGSQWCIVDRFDPGIVDYLLSLWLFCIETRLNTYYIGRTLVSPTRSLVK